MDPYREAHLFLAAIRVLEHQKQGPPSVNEVCELLGFSLEFGSSVVRKLKSRNIVQTYDDPFSVKLAIADHLEAEKLPREENKDGGLAKELEEFMAKKKNQDKKVEAIQAEMKKKQQAMFQDLEAKLKKQLQGLEKKAGE